MAAGLLVIPPQEGWRATIVASDPVVGDHGSTSLYSAAAERAVLLAATGLDELDPDSPTAEFGRRAVRLDPTGDLHALLREAGAAAERFLLEAVAERPWDTPRPRLDPLLGAAVNLWLTSGADPTSLKNGLLIRTGHRHVRVNFDPGL